MRVVIGLRGVLVQVSLTSFIVKKPGLVSPSMTRTLSPNRCASRLSSPGLNNGGAPLSPVVSVRESEHLTSSGGRQYSSNAKTFTGRPLTYVEALKYAHDFVRRLPLGSQFTCYRLFQDVQVSFDRRRLANIIMNLRKCELIDRVSYVPEDRHTGNRGIVALFEKVKEVA